MGKSKHGVNQSYFKGKLVDIMSIKYGMEADRTRISSTSTTPNVLHYSNVSIPVSVTLISCTEKMTLSW